MEESLEASVRSFIRIVEIGLVVLLLIFVIDYGLRPNGWARRFGSAVSRLFKRVFRKPPVSPAGTVEPPQQDGKPVPRIVKDGGSPPSNNNAGSSDYRFPDPTAHESGMGRKRPPPEKSN